MKWVVKIKNTNINCSTEIFTFINFKDAWRFYLKENKMSFIWDDPSIYIYPSRG